MDVHIVSHWFSKHKEKQRYFEEHVDPSFFPEVKGRKLKANPLHQKILAFGDTFEQKMYLLSKYIGAYVGEEQEFELEKIRKIIGFKITPSLKVSEPFLHGWYTSRTLLEGCIQYYAPKTVVELGVWYGKSTVGMLQASSQKLDYYGFDFFTPTATNPDYVTKSRLDEMFLQHFRLESAVANVVPYCKKHNLYFLLHDVLDSLSVLTQMKIVPDLVFVDAIKHTGDLRKTIQEYLEYNPNIVLVGDDYEFGSVQRAVAGFKNKRVYEKCYLITNREIPDVFPEPVSDFSEYPQLQLRKKDVPQELQSYVNED